MATFPFLRKQITLFYHFSQFLFWPDCFLRYGNSSAAAGSNIVVRGAYQNYCHSFDIMIIKTCFVQLLSHYGMPRGFCTCICTVESLMQWHKLHVVSQLQHLLIMSIHLSAVNDVVMWSPSASLNVFARVLS